MVGVISVHLHIKFLRMNAWPKGLNNITSAVGGSAPSETDVLSCEIGIGRLGLKELSAGINFLRKD